MMVCDYEIDPSLLVRWELPRIPLAVRWPTGGIGIGFLGVLTQTL